MNAQKVHSTYAPDKLLNGLITSLNLKNDEALAGILGVSPFVINNIRNNDSPVDAFLLIRMQEIIDLSFNDLRWWMGDRRHKFRFSDKTVQALERFSK
jgi:plasmid maintenance system antidote protein VapI